MSKEYVGAVVLILGSLLKIFGLEIPNDAIEGIVWGGVAIWIAYNRYKKGDINPLGIRKG
jgi:hypothetical protein